MPSLVDRVAAIERLLAELTPNEALQPTYLTIDSAGRAGASFSGKVHAQGLDLTAGTISGPPDANRVSWLVAADAFKVADEWGYETAALDALVLKSYSRDNARTALLTLHAENPATGITTALDLFANDAGTGGLGQLIATVGAAQRHLLNSDGSSDFMAPTVIVAPAALPAAPYDRQLVIYQNANGANWLLRYNAGSASAFKWEFLGGTPLLSEVATDQTLNNAAYNDLATVGPSITLPLAGDYISRHGARFHNDAAAVQNSYMALKRGAAATVDADASQAFAGATGTGGAVGAHGRTLRANGAAAGDVYKCQYKNGAAGLSGWSGRWLELTPVRVG